MIPQPIPAQAIIAQLGGVATTPELMEQLSIHDLRVAVDKGHVVRLARGRYCTRTSADGVRAAAQVAGVASHLSAALLHGWKVARTPSKPWVTVPRNRKVSPSARETMNIVYADRSGSLTAPVQTVLDCARRLPLGEALSVADSALREQDVTKDELQAAARLVRGKGAGQCRGVVAAASGLAANPFESMTRALALGVGLDVVPRVKIALPGVDVHPDLVDVRRALVIECEGLLHHGRDRETFDRDIWRYTMLTAQGWVVLRFAHTHIFGDDSWAKECLARFV